MSDTAPAIKAPSSTPPLEERKFLLTSPRPLQQPAPGEPSMNMSRIKTYRDNPSQKNERYAAELLERCGPLVLDQVQYRLNEGKIEAVPVELLMYERRDDVNGIDPYEFNIDDAGQP